MSDVVPGPGFFVPNESSSVFPQTSRYATIPTARLDLPGGHVMVYLTRRFIPEAGSLSEVGALTVAEGDRLDLLAARAYGQAELHWRIADANQAFDPFDLTASPGQRLRITLGASGGSNA
jgi:nucleoid-associated protein YgaU